jgi:CHASE2 domain-containing sensor protein
MSSWPAWATWLVVSLAFLVSIVRAIRWRDQPGRTSFVVPTSIAVASFGALMNIPWLAVLGLAGIAAGFGVDRYFTWRSDTYGSMRRERPLSPQSRR